MLLELVAQPICHVCLLAIKYVQTNLCCNFQTHFPGADPGFLDRGFKFRKGGSFS